MRLNGWQRTGLVIFALWAVGVFIWERAERVNNARFLAYAACQSSKATPETWGTATCGHEQDVLFEKFRQDALEGEIQEALLVIFTPPFIVLLLWIFSFAVTATWYWILAGFSKAEKYPVLSHSFILTGWITILIVLSIAYAIR